MYKHESSNGEDVETVESDADSDSDDESIHLDVEEIKPVMEKLEEAFEKLSVNLKKHFGPLKCDSCEFKARNEDGLTMHKRANTQQSNILTKQNSI